MEDLKEKVCTTCKVMKSASDYRVRNGKSPRLRSECRECENRKCKLRYQRDIETSRKNRRKYGSDWRTKNPEKDKASNIRTKIRQMGLHNSIELIENQLSSQLVCEICKEPERNNKRLSIDHCHASITFRGLLCNNCNTGLGFFKDNPEVLRLAADYLEKERG